jgi:hypothetical protein
MRFNLNAILIIIIILLLGGGYFMYSKMNETINEEVIAKKKVLLKNDELKKLADGWYSKFVADSSSRKSLEKLVDSLELEVNNPQGVGSIIVRPIDTISITDTIIVNNTTKQVEITDYYPSKENYFLKYNNRFYLEDTSVGTSKFIWKPISIDVVISEEQGTFKADFKVPPYLKIDKVDIRTTPLSLREKKDNFGYLIGASWGSDLTTGGNFVEFGGGVRYKKVYGIIDFNTLNQVEIGLKYEF